MIKMAQLEDIRKMYFMEGLSIREINRRTGIHRDTISKYISLEEPKPPKYKLTKERKHPVLGPYIPLIKQIIEEDKHRHRKQRHTGTKIFEILKKEGFTGGYNTVMDYLRKEYRKQREAFLPLAPVYEQYRRSLNSRSPKGNREFVRILMLHRDYPLALVTEAVEIAMAYNVYSYDGVLNILMQLLVSERPKIAPVSRDKLQNIPEVVVIPPDISKYSVLMSGGGQ